MELKSSYASEKSKMSVAKNDRHKKNCCVTLTSFVFCSWLLLPQSVVYKTESNIKSNKLPTTWKFQNPYKLRSSCTTRSIDSFKVREFKIIFRNSQQNDSTFYTLKIDELIIRFQTFNDRVLSGSILCVSNVVPHKNRQIW